MVINIINMTKTFKTKPPQESDHDIQYHISNGAFEGLRVVPFLAWSQILNHARWYQTPGAFRMYQDISDFHLARKSEGWGK